MSAPFVIPFNFQPSNTGRTTGTYTVPAGKYAHVNVSVGISARVGNGAIDTSTDYTVTDLCTDSEASNHIVSLWVKSGDVITFSLIDASGNATSQSTGTNQRSNNASSSSTNATINLNGSSIAVFYATAQASCIFDVNSGGATSINYATFTGTSTAVIQFSEFNEIS